MKKKEKNNKKSIIFILIILSILIIFSFVVSYLGDRKIDKRREDIINEVKEYLKNKYNEDFNIDSYTIELIPLDLDNGLDEVIQNTELYNFKITSNRLITFDLIYVNYIDDNLYKNNEEYNILNEGIYDNYIYLYKVKDIKNEVKEDIENTFDKVRKVEVHLTDLGNYIYENLLVRKSLDSKEEIELYDKYLNYKKDISNKDFYNTTMAITNGNLILNIDSNDFIDESNLNNFKNDVKEIVRYLNDKGYDNYDINFSFNKYQSARITKFLDDNDKESIYIIFDYDSYTNIDDNDKLGSYIVEK